MTVRAFDDLPTEVFLRDVEDADLPIFFDHQREPEANRMAAFPARDRDRFTAHWNKILRDETVIARTVVAGGRVVGNVVCWGPPEERDVGYWIGSEHWGKGLATRALARFLDQVRERPLFAHVATHNVASIRVLEKGGFVPLRGVGPIREGDELVLTLT